MAKAKPGGMRKAFSALAAHRRKGAPTDIGNAFARDPKRFPAFSVRTGGLLLDHSKCAVNARTMKLLSDLAGAADVAGKRDRMFAGDIINTTEGRAVLHTALRNRSNVPVLV
ncbi:MAG: glucose-6-phosphate isomerase, partial [Aestuariivirga sp.]